jgi:dihydroxyacid dehydratase/phosphogluconate dehydratase
MLTTSIARLQFSDYDNEWRWPADVAYNTKKDAMEEGDFKADENKGKKMIDAVGKKKENAEKEEKAKEEGDESIEEEAGHVCATCNKTFTSHQAPCLLLEGLHLAERCAGADCWC